MKTKASVFDGLMAELMSDVGNNDMLEESMSLNPDRIKKVPLRIRIIALGFFRKQSLDEVNNVLREHNCAALYSRSLWEASLIFAFLHKYSYKEWENLRDICSDFRSEQELQDPFFNNPSISLQDIKHYLDKTSSDQQGVMVTRHLTRMIEEKIHDIHGEEDAFRVFLQRNIESFSPVREKTRYYFCKYLYYMLLTRIDEYADSLKLSLANDDILEDLTKLFKGTSPLKRKKRNPEDAKQHLLQSSLSPGGIFDMFNEFFFNYISNDWMMILIDDYGSIDSIPPEEKHVLAEHLRSYDPDKYNGLTDDQAVYELQKEEAQKEAERDRIYSLEGSGGRGYQRNRVGENIIRKYIKGALDIDRSTLVCFLLFFGNKAKLDDADKITPERLTEILLECGFPGLREEDDFDCFVMDFLEASDSADYLISEALFYAQREENFYLYRVYNEFFKKSYSNSQAFSG